MPELSPTMDSRANGFTERADQELEGHVRTVVHALESKRGTTIDASDNVLHWRVCHAAMILNRVTKLNADGKTAHARLRGRKSRIYTCEFGEIIMYMPADAFSQIHLHSRCQHGIWLALRHEYDEPIVGTAASVFNIRSIKRKVFEHRWDHDAVKRMQGASWKPCPAVSGDELRIRPQAHSSTAPCAASDAELEGSGERQTPRRFRTERRDLERVG